MRFFGAVLVLLLLFHGAVQAVQLKELDSDIIYEEENIAHYDLPPLLVTGEGKTITTAEEWTQVRRPQIIGLFSNLVYGRVPVPEIPVERTMEVIEEDTNFFSGNATRKKVKISFKNEQGEQDLVIVVFTPNDATGPVPAFMKHSFNDTSGNDFDMRKGKTNRVNCGWPIAKILDRGFAFIAVDQSDLVGHNEVEFSNNTIHQLYLKKGQSFPKAHEWGVLSGIAFGASQALDYVETDAAIDATRVLIMGHSKCGKAALWTAAQDERFAMAISAQSGCAGAALWRRKSGETLEKIVTRFPYWLCRNAWKFVGNEDDLPVDQHMLLASIAPRPVYVASGIKDGWADPRGEYASAYHASEVYKLFGLKVLDSPEFPELSEPVIESHVGYHVRPGGHSVGAYDWDRFIEFAEYHFLKK